MLTPQEIKAVDEWRYDNRIPSRSAAARALMNIGLRSKVSATDRDDALEGPASSGDFGIVNNDPEIREALDPEAGPKVLVVDGELLIGHGVKSLIQDAGYRVIGPASDSDEAFALVKEREIAAAVLETNLGENGELEKLIETLSSRNIPYLFCTGEDPRKRLPQRFWSAPVVSKLSAQTHLKDAVTSLID